MFDFYLRRLPTPETVRSSWLFHLFGPSMMRLEYWVPSRHSLALGIGLGWFVGMTPLFGVQIALGLLLGTLARCHLPAVVFGTFISNPFTVPGILAIQYLAGRWICSVAWFPALSSFAESSVLLRHLVPLLAGGLVSAILAGVMGYALVWIYLGWRRRNSAGWVV
jgi:uncharacterized protein (DUF2062 family)